jgi:hypothetical protein
MSRMPALFPLILIATLSLPWSSSARAEPPRAAETLTFAQVERNAVALKQGMSATDVQKLLGKPRRTGLKNNGAGNAPGSLQWTYSWTGTSSSSAAGSLRVDFSAKAPEDWYVTSWEWGTY